MSSEAGVVKLIKQRWCMPEWATFSNVEVEGGYADAIAVNLWRSRGYKVIGFEVKTARSDWLRELKDPAKAERAAKFCHEFYVVADPGVVKPGELPLGWGLVETCVRSEAPALISRNPSKMPEPKGITVALMMSIVRRASEQGAGVTELAAARMLGVEQGIAEEKGRHASSPVQRMQDEIDRYKKRDAEFFEKTGIQINQWSDAGSLAEIEQVRSAIKKARIPAWPIDQLEHAVEAVRSARKTIDAIVEQFTGEK